MKKISLKHLSRSRKKQSFFHGFGQKTGHIFKSIFGRFQDFSFFTILKKIPRKLYSFFSHFHFKSKKHDVTHRVSTAVLGKKSIKHFFSDLHQKIQQNKLLSNPYFTRIVIICFFLGLNIQLLPHFLKTTRVKLPDEIMSLLDSAGVLNKEDYNFEYVPPQLKGEEPSLDPKIIFEKLNAERVIREKEPFLYSDRLASAAAELLQEAEKYEYELENRSFTDEFIKALKTAGYNYEHVSQNMVVGPLLEDAVIDAWFSNEAQVSALFDSDFKEVGFATKIIKTKYNETLGVTMQVLGTELPKRLVSQTQNTQPTQSTVMVKTNAPFPPIANESVFDALNNYRQSHNIYKLNLDENLCKYAEKRVQDLVALGALDNHEGFRKDWEDPNNLPQPIKDFNGEKIGENLAYQSCRNMTTGDGFIAQTGAAIIEWCFDSSTAGHREAQLSTEFTHACVRNQNGFFVIIFGRR